MDAVWFGCIPVLIADHYIPPLTDLLDWGNIAVVVPEAKVRLKQLVHLCIMCCIILGIHVQCHVLCYMYSKIADCNVYLPFHFSCMLFLSLCYCAMHMIFYV